jgi:hypothetical protein
MHNSLVMYKTQSNFNPIKPSKHSQTSTLPTSWRAGVVGKTLTINPLRRSNLTPFYRNYPQLKIPNVINV